MDDLFKCERLDNKGKRIDHVPVGDEQQERWIKSRKLDQHLDVDFLPRNLVYNYGNFQDSNLQMEQVLSQIHELNYGGQPRAMEEDNALTEELSRSIMMT